jgi:hypothetical protein
MVNLLKNIRQKVNKSDNGILEAIIKTELRFPKKMRSVKVARIAP